MKTLLLDLDDTLLAYSAGVDDSWVEACGAVPLSVDTATLVAALTETRKWFWSGDPARHARERVNMLGAWTTRSPPRSPATLPRGAAPPCDCFRRRAPCWTRSARAGCRWRS